MDSGTSATYANGLSVVRHSVKKGVKLVQCRECGGVRRLDETWKYYCSKVCYRQWYNRKRRAETKTFKKGKSLVPRKADRHCLKCGEPNLTEWFCHRCRLANRELIKNYSTEALGVVRPFILDVTFCKFKLDTE